MKVLLRKMLYWRCLPTITLAIGESVPKTINKKMAKQFDFLKEGDVLTEEFILALPPEQQEIADQINRRTEFKVLRTNYNLF